MKGRRADRIRLLLAATLAAIGLVIGWPVLFGSGAPDEFDGAVIVIPGEPEVSIGVRVAYEPPSTESLAQARGGLISIMPQADEGPARGTNASLWYVLLTDDAQLDGAQIVDQEASGDARDAPSVRGEFAGTEYQWFELELLEGQRLIGSPDQSPLVEVAGRYELTMPSVLSTSPAQGWERDGGVVFLEEPWIELFATNPQMHPAAVPNDWYAPRAAHFMVSGGIHESNVISVARTTPDLDDARWGNLTTWDSNRPIATSATFVDYRTTLGPDLRLGVTFLFFGASLPLLIEALVPREQLAPSTLPGAGKPPRAPTSKPTKRRPKSTPNRRRK